MNSDNPAYTVWKNMRQRCSNKNRPDYEHYGGRGITVCEEWNSFQKFSDDMGPRPEGYTLERVDNDGNYEPDNCIWATRADQVLNRRTTTEKEFCYRGHKRTVRGRNGYLYCNECAAEHARRYRSAKKLRE